jgi:archaellum component FlaC
MAMTMNPRERWTDERLDDLNVKVDSGFADLKAEMKEGFERMEARFGDRFDAVDKRFDAVDKRFDAVDKRFDDFDKRVARLEEAYFALNRTMWGGTCVIVAALIGSGILG